MSYVRIVSQRKGGTRAREGERVVTIDRSHPLLGNKDVLVDHRDATERDLKIDSFAGRLALDEAANGPMTVAIRDLARIVDSGQPLAFQCWCAPRRCHGEPIRDLVSRILGRDVRPPDEVKALAPPAAQQVALF